MKTPQEEAESLICYTENKIAQKEIHYGTLTNTERKKVKEVLIKEIPLTELIAFAREAKRTNHHCLDCVCRFCETLRALQAKGKVEL